MLKIYCIYRNVISKSALILKNNFRRIMQCMALFFVVVLFMPVVIFSFALGTVFNSAKLLKKALFRRCCIFQYDDCCHGD